MTNEISIVDNKRVGILKVKYEGDAGPAGIAS